MSEPEQAAIGKSSRCAVCNCEVLQPFCNPLDFENRTTCWYHADYYYIFHPERYEEAQKWHLDVPRFLGMSDGGI